jgi:hypothetical protein
MKAVHFDSAYPDAERRRRLYEGDIFVLSPSAATLELVNWTRSILEEAFAPHAPLEAQHAMDVHSFVEVFGPAKPRFIHHPTTKALLRKVLATAGCDLEDIYADVPRLRGVTSDGYLTAGVGYAHPMHRDTWFSAPMAQLNWWMPIYEFESESSMAFHPQYWSEGVRNGSAEFNYYEWNRVGRADAAKHVTSDTRKQPKIEEPVAEDPQVRLVVPPGGIVLFSGAQMHSTVPNTTGVTRFSIDFRTISLSDVVAGRSAPNIDSRPTGTSLRDFVRGSDASPIPEEIVRRYDSGPVDAASAVFRPAVADTLV